MVRTTDEILQRVKEYVGGNSDDSTLELVADISDTLRAGEDNRERITELETQVQEIDSTWRQKYRDRFFNTSENENDFEPEQNEKKKPTSFEELFKIKE